ncbi:MAG: hypothetical protein AB1489_36580, partial [Acidobacteriota bacterium]
TGRELGFYSGKDFLIADLPANGALQSSEGIQPIRLGIVTPYKVNGYDALTIIYGKRKSSSGIAIPQLVLAEASQEQLSQGEGIARAVSPDLTTTASPPGGGGRGGSGGIGKVEDDAGLLPGDRDRGDLPPPGGGKGGVPPGGGSGGPPKGGNNNVIPAGLFNIGDLMLLIGTPALRNRGVAVGPIQPVARLVRLTATPQLTIDNVWQRQSIEFRYNLCEIGSCGPQLPNLTNLTIVRQFRAGSMLVPVNLVSFYLVPEAGRMRMMRNDGGSILPVNGVNGLEFQVVGGRNSFVGEADSLAISYLLKDGSERATPTSPIVDWLNQVVAVRVAMSRSVTVPDTQEKISRTNNTTFPLTIQMLE